MSYKSLTHFISALESAGELIRIKEPVSPKLEIAEIADRMVKNNGPALLFENTGTRFPLLINAFASDRRICMALGVKSLDEVGCEFQRIIREVMGPKERFLDRLRLLPVLQELSSWMPKVISGRGLCQENVMTPPDLSRLPVLTCWPADGGPFITLPSVHTKEPATGIRNVGMYRMQVFSNDLTGMHWHLHKGSAHHFYQYRQLKKRMPVTVTLGGDPVYTYAATAPLPENIDEYLLAGFLRKKKVEMVKCLTNELEVPSDVDFVIEGYVDPEEEFILEGPFGDHTGFYSLADYYPRFHVTCITHRRDAVYPATIVGVPPQEDGWIGKATERIFLEPLKMTMAGELEDMHLPMEGVFHNLALVKIRKTYPGHALKVMNSLWGAGQMMFNKIMIVLDQPSRLTDYRQIARQICEKVDPLSDIHFMKGPVDILDHSSEHYAYGSKAGIDATTKFHEEEGHPAELQEPVCDFTRIKDEFQEIREIYTGFLNEGISVVILSILKQRKRQIREMVSSVLKMELIRHVKFILFVDAVVDVSRISEVVWITANNIDPIRDCFFVQKENGTHYPSLIVDGTRKTRELDDFQREWPEIIVMDDATIGMVDQKWSSYGIGPYHSSPSLIYKSLVINHTNLTS